MSRPGRNRKSVRRQPNGQPARSTRLEEQETRSVVIAYRQKQGLSEEQAKRMEAESELGRMAILGQLAKNEGINSALYLAGEFYLQTRNKAQQARQCRQMKSGGDLERTGGYYNMPLTPEYVEQCQRAIERDEELRNGIGKGGAWENALDKVTAPSREDWVTNPIRFQMVMVGLQGVRRYMLANGVQS